MCATRTHVPHSPPLLDDSPVPKYVQIADILRQRIARGIWRKGTRLPANEALAAEFGVARVTVRQAVDIVAREGLLRAEQGRGTFITGSVADDRWLRVETTLADLAEVYRDTSPEILNLSEGEADPPLKPQDGQPVDRYVYMRRRHSRAGRAYCMISIYLSAEIFRRAPSRFRKQTIIPILKDMKLIRSAHQTLTIGVADLEVARHLGIALNSPVAEVRRVFRSAKNEVIYLAEVTYRGDFVRIEMDLRP